VLSISIDDRRKASATSLKEVGYYFSEIEVIKERFLSNLVDAVAYRTQTSYLLQILLKTPAIDLLPSSKTASKLTCPSG